MTLSDSTIQVVARQGFSERHNQGAVVGSAGGSSEYIKFRNFTVRPVLWDPKQGIRPGRFGTSPGILRIR